jgi:hypothetical protein
VIRHVVDTKQKSSAKELILTNTHHKSSATFETLARSSHVKRNVHSRDLASVFGWIAFINLHFAKIRSRQLSSDVCLHIVFMMSVLEECERTRPFAIASIQRPRKNRV